MICKKCGKDTENYSVLCIDCTKQLKDKIAKITNEIKKAEDNAELYITRANCYEEFKQYNKALADYNKAIELESDNAELYIIRANCYSESEKYENAICDYSKVIELEPDNTEAYFKRGEVKMWAEYTDDAINDFNEVIKRNPNNALAYSHRAYCNRIISCTDAIQDFNKALELEPRNDKIYEDLECCEPDITTEVLVNFVDYCQDNIENYKHIVKFFEHYLDDMFSSDYYDDEKKPHYAKLARMWQNYIKRFPNNIESYKNEITFLEESYLYEYDFIDDDERIYCYTRLLEDYTKLEDNDKIGYTYYKRGDWYYESDCYDDAVKDFKKALEYELPDDIKGEIYCNLAEVYYKDGYSFYFSELYEEAIKCYTKALELDIPNDARERIEFEKNYCEVKLEFPDISHDTYRMQYDKNKFFKQVRKHIDNKNYNAVKQILKENLWYRNEPEYILAKEFAEILSEA